MHGSALMTTRRADPQRHVGWATGNHPRHRRDQRDRTPGGGGRGSAFAKGRDLAAWLGLTPRQHSTGGRTKLLGISKRGNKCLRAQLIHGARAARTHFAKHPRGSTHKYANCSSELIPMWWSSRSPPSWHGLSRRCCVTVAPLSTKVCREHDKIAPRRRAGDAHEVRGGEKQMA
jgi:Transposase IS116/IS110/IS902 family